MATGREQSSLAALVDSSTKRELRSPPIGGERSFLTAPTPRSRFFYRVVAIDLSVIAVDVQKK